MLGSCFHHVKYTYVRTFYILARISSSMVHGTLRHKMACNLFLCIFPCLAKQQSSKTSRNKKNHPLGWQIKKNGLYIIKNEILIHQTSQSPAEAFDVRCSGPTKKHHEQQGRSFNKSLQLAQHMAKHTYNKKWLWYWDSQKQTKPRKPSRKLYLRTLWEHVQCNLGNLENVELPTLGTVQEPLLKNLVGTCTT